MEKILFYPIIRDPKADQDEFGKMYSCSGITVENQYSAEDQYSGGNENIQFGILFMIAAIICAILYLPFLIVLLKEKFYHFSVYKIMFHLGIMDFMFLFLNSIIFGILLNSEQKSPVPGKESPIVEKEVPEFENGSTVFGEISCSHLNDIYILGCFSNALWMGTCIICVVLELNRYFEIFIPKICWKLFKGKKTYIWLILTTIYSLYFWFFIDSFSNSNYSAFFFRFYFGIKKTGKIGINENQQDHQPTTTNTIIFVVFLIVSQFLLFLIILLKVLLKKQETYLNVIQKKIFIQVFIICCLKGIAAFFYLYM
ncbi:hypothetical protein FO519_009664 [Halicephalobus sp. NKZ332]|nr:hypothetical protein FO519_009664 [Halicephalobus sp. NKZ332]